MRNGFEYYKQLLAEVSINPGVATWEDSEDIHYSSMEEKARLALYSLEELNDCHAALQAGLFNERGLAGQASIFSLHSYSLILSLIYPLSMYDGFSQKDFLYVLDSGYLIMVSNIILNALCPLNFLVDEEQHARYRSFSGWSHFQVAVKKARKGRYEEVVTFCRDTVPSSEHMSDEMVLSIAGIQV